MTNDINHDPRMKETQNGMYAAQWRATGWGLATMGLGILGVMTLPVFGLGVIPLAAAVYTGYRAFQANTEVRAGEADIQAIRAADRMGEMLAQQQQFAPQQGLSNDTRWQQQVAAQAAAIALAAQQNPGRR